MSEARELRITTVLPVRGTIVSKFPSILRLRDDDKACSTSPSRPWFHHGLIEPFKLVDFNFGRFRDSFDDSFRLE